MEAEPYMADNRLKEKDFTAESEALVAETESLVQAQPDQLDAALERLLALEKQTRQVRWRYFACLDAAEYVYGRNVYVLWADEGNACSFMLMTLYAFGVFIV